MKSNRLTFYLGLTWLLTVGIAYVIGWWVGVKSVTHAAADAAHSGIWFVLIALAAVAVITAVAVFRAKDSWDHRRQSPAPGV